MTRAVIRKINGRLVLEDPDALAVARAVAKHNCREFLELTGERVAHFTQRAKDQGREDLVIAIVHVDDTHGGPLAEVIMPGHNWQEYRDRNELPMMRGLLQRDTLIPLIETFDLEAAEKLTAAGVTPVVVIAHGVAEVYESTEGVK